MAMDSRIGETRDDGHRADIRVRCGNTLLRDKMLFESDGPAITPGRRMPLGLYQSTSNFTTAITTCDSLSVEDRAAMARAANRAGADFTNRWGREMPIEAEAAARAAGIEIIVPDAVFLAALKAFVDTEYDTAARVAKERFGIQDADARITRFRDLYAKWEAVAVAADNDPVAMARRIQDDVWSKVDFATYGK